MKINEPTKPEIWNKIRDFEMDETGAAIPFSGKLGRQNNWPAAFALRAIEEYKSFSTSALSLPTELHLHPS